MSNSLRQFLNNCARFAQTRIAQPCVLCGGRAVGALLCPGCRADLPLLPEERCPGCALPSPGGEVCGRCLRHPHAFDHCEAAWRYAFPLDALIQRCKYAGAAELTELLAQGLAERLRGRPMPDLILPMPLHPARIRQRGYNQAMEIARRLSPRLGVPVLHACQRVRDTPPQAGLDLPARKKNLRGAFVCEEILRGKRLALLDDVMTSGGSLDELARAARRAGALEIHAWAAARTL